MNLFNQAQKIYNQSLETDPKAHEALKSIGVTSGEWAKALGIGWASGKAFRDTLSKEEIKEAVNFGILKQRHTDTLREQITFPLYIEGEIQGFFGWKYNLSRRHHAGGAKDSFLNEEALIHDEIIVTNSPVTYVQLRQCGFDNAVCVPFPEEADYFYNRLKASKVSKVYISARKNKETIFNAIQSLPVEIMNIGLDTQKTLTWDRVDVSLKLAVKMGEGKPKSPCEINQKARRRNKNGNHILTYGDMTYRIQPLNLVAASLKVILTVQVEEERYTDKIDLLIASSRRAFAKGASERLCDDSTQIESDLHKIISELETLRDNEITAEVQVSTLTDQDEEEAQAVLSNPNIFDEFVTDMKSCGFVGEEQNLKLGLLMSVSRLLDKPLSVIVQSSAGVGKSHLLNTICNITPPESVIFMSKLSPSSLYYMESLAHKLLCVDEAHGSEGALYPLRTLQSNHKLVLAVPVKDSATGGTITKQIQVKGPVSFIESTTSDSLHPENASRALILKMDESPEQTQRILEAQRTTSQRGYRDSSEAIKKKWQNIQRVLSKTFLPVVIPFAHLLKFPTGPNARRDNQKFISLIKAVTLLRSHQRVRSSDSEGEYISATVDDYRISYDLYKPLLSTSQDELSPRGREFLKVLTNRDRTPFTRRQIMEEHGLSHSKVIRCMKELIGQEIVVEDITAKGQAARFVLLDTYIPDLECKGLASPDEVGSAYLSRKGVE